LIGVDVLDLRDVAGAEAPGGHPVLAAGRSVNGGSFYPSFGSPAFISYL
jgi:hypothetical protein